MTAKTILDLIHSHDVYILVVQQAQGICNMAVEEYRLNSSATIKLLR